MEDKWDGRHHKRLKEMNEITAISEKQRFDLIEKENRDALDLPF